MLTLAGLTEVHQAVRSALLVETGRPATWRWSGRASGDEFLAAVARHGVAATLADHLPALGVSPAVAATVRTWRDSGRLRAMTRLRALAEIGNLLEDVPHLVVKGAALALQTTGDPTGRGPGDIDLFVSPDDLPVVVDRLTSSGWTARAGYTVDRDGWAWRHQLKATYELVLDGAADSIDLHWRLDPTHDGLPSFDEVWQRHVTVDAGSVTVPTLRPADAFVHALRHAAKDDWGVLRSLVDIHRLARDPAHRSLPLDHLSRVSLAVTDACVGLPEPYDDLPAPGRDLVRALDRQRHELDVTRFLGDNGTRMLRYCLRSSRSPRDVRTALSAMFLPPMLVADVTERRTTLAVAIAVGRRTRSSARQLRRRVAS